MLKRSLKKVLITLLLAGFCMPAFAYKPSPEIVSAYAKIALKEFYANQFDDNKSNQYKNFNYTNPIIVNTTVSDDFGHKRNVTCVAFQDYSRKNTWGFVIFDIKDKMVQQILSRGGMTSDDIHGEMKILAKEVFESP